MKRKNLMDGEKNRIVINLLRLGAFLQREGGRMAGDFGLNQQQFVVLKQIEVKGPVNQKGISGDLLYEKSNVSKIVKKLEENGLVRRTVSRDDRRVELLSATRRGISVADACMKRMNEWNRNWLKSLTEKEVKRAAEMLGKIYRIR